MCTVKRHLVWLAISVCGAAAGLLYPAFSATPPPPERFYYGFTMKGKLVGHLSVSITSGDAAHPRTIESVLSAKVRLLGSDYDIHKTESYRVDPVTRRIIRYESATTAGTVISGAIVTVEGGAARYFSKSDGRNWTVRLPSDVLFYDPFHRPYCNRDLPKTGQIKRYRFLDVEDGSLHNLRMTRTGTEELVLAGRHRCAVFEMFDENKVEKAVIWIDLESSRWVKMALPDGSTLSLADAAIVQKAARAVVDDMILTPVDARIPKYRDIASMKIRVKMRVSGEVVTPESLNTAGQRFQGTVRENLVEGVFEVRWPPHDHPAAAAFPARFDNASLSKYLLPEPGIESTDPDIRNLARHLTGGATNTWQAAQRLADWVAREIRPFAVGGSARQTLASRQGACQSYASLLAALCRSVGIPARLVSGCMYLPRDGRGFVGGHFWTEIYVGEAGWIAVDANHAEINVLDSGHIRLGTRAIPAPLEAQVLEYSLRQAR